MILTWLILTPAIGGSLAWIVSRWSVSAARWVALAACAGVVALALGAGFGDPAPSMGGTLLDQHAPWVPSLGISYHLSMDGLSLILVLLTGVLGLVAVGSAPADRTGTPPPDRAGFAIQPEQKDVGAFLFLLMLLLTGIIGVFLAYDLLLFYFFWELMLVPMYFLIGFWGHENRVYAAIKFFLFTFIGGLFMLLAIIGLYVMHGRATGVYTFDYPALLATAMPARYALWLMLGFFVGFAVKLPTVPLHTWLPDAHTEAPTAGSVILAGLMLKTGAYGLIRFAIPLFPAASVMVAPAACVLGVVSILYGAILTFAQTDFKRMVAYSSVSHMGFVLLGIFAGNKLALQGAVMEIVSHGVATGALFLIAGMIQDRTHTRDLQRLGGLWATIPKMGGFTMLFALAALGLPGLGNFVGEFLVLLGTFQTYPTLAIIGSFGFVLSVIYGLKLIQASMLGPNDNNWSLPDPSPREMASLGLLAALIFWLGLFPQPVFDAAKPSLVPVEQSLSEPSGQEARADR